MKGAPIEARESDQVETIAEILSQADRALSHKEIMELWPLQQSIGKNKLRELLRDGAAEGHWFESGKGGRNDPYRYEMLSDSPDSSRHGYDANKPGTILLESSVTSEPPNNLIKAHA